MSKRVEKKSETLEVRLSYSQKKALMEACEQKGISASEAVRGQIEGWLQTSDPSPKFNTLGATLSMLKQHKTKLLSSVASGVAALSLAFALPSTADGSNFVSYDRNGDGVLTAGEISPNDSKVIAMLDKDGSGTITADEFQETAEVTDVTDTIEKDKDGKDTRLVTVQRTSFVMNAPGDVDVYVQNWAEHVPLDASEADIRNVVERLSTQIDDVRNFKAIDDMSPAEKERWLARVGSLEELAELEKLKELEDIQIELSSLDELGLKLEDLKALEMISIDIADLTSDLADIEIELEGLDELAELEALSELGDLSKLESLSELSKFAELAALSELHALSALDHDGAHVRVIRKNKDMTAQELAELEKTLAELEKLENAEQVFVIRKSDKDADGKDQTVVEKRSVVKIIKKDGETATPETDN